MLNEIFGPKIANDFKKGIERFSDVLKVDDDKVQIRLTLTQDENRPIVYELCKEWRVERETNYKEIMGIRVDFLNQEGLVVPTIYQMMVYHGEKLSISANNLSACLFKKDVEVGVAIFDGSNCVEVNPIQEMMKME